MIDWWFDILVDNWFDAIKKLLFLRVGFSSFVVISELAFENRGLLVIHP